MQFSLCGMKWFALSCSTLLFAVVKASIPEQELTESLTFDQYFNELVTDFTQEKAKKFNSECHYPLVKLILTLGVYCDDVGAPACKLIMNELRNSFYLMNTELRHNHISGLEVMINRALTAVMFASGAENVMPILRFLDEALTTNHPLSSYSVPMTLFPDYEAFLEFEKDELNFGPIFSVTEKYEEMIQATVLEVMKNFSRSDGQLTEAGIIDLLILILQHFRGMFYDFGLTGVAFKKIVYMTTRFPEAAFTAFATFIQKGRNLESSEAFYEALYAHLCANNPYEFAVLKRVLDLNILNDGSFDLNRSMWSGPEGFESSSIGDRFWSVVENPKTLDELRVYMTAISLVASCNPLFRIREVRKIPPKFDLCFAFSAVMKVKELFNDGAGALVASSESVYELESGVRNRIPVAAYYLIMTYCIKYGAFETIKLLLSLDAKIKKDKNDLIPLAISSENSKLVVFLLEKFPITSLGISSINDLFIQAAAHSSLEIVKYIADCLPMLNHKTHSAALKKAVDNYNFVVFEFLCERYEAAIKTWGKNRRNKIISNALESCFPEAKIREYISKYGVLHGSMAVNGRLLLPAAENGYAALIQDYNLSNTDFNIKLEALKKAAKNHHDSIVELLIDSLALNSNFIRITHTCQYLIQANCREGLRYFVEKKFGAVIEPARKAEILLALITYSCFLDYDSDSTVTERMVSFCVMLGWSRLQIEYSGANQVAAVEELYRSEELKWNWKSDFDQIMVKCLESLPLC